MNPNSTNVYENIVKPTAETRRKEIKAAIKVLGPSTMEQVADYLDTFVHVISGRFGELQRTEELEIVGQQDNFITINGNEVNGQKGIYGLVA